MAVSPTGKIVTRAVNSLQKCSRCYFGALLPAP